MRLWGRTRDEMPDEARGVLNAEPPQDNAMGVVLHAWEDLSTCRPIGMAVGPIPWTAAMEWCDRHDLDEQSARLLWSVIKRLDRDELSRQDKNRPAPSHE